MMKRIMLHVIVFVVLAPCVLMLSEGNLLVNIFGFIYAVWVAFWFSYSPRGLRLFRDYRDEIRRIEYDMSH